MLVDLEVIRDEGSGVRDDNVQVITGRRTNEGVRPYRVDARLLGRVYVLLQDIRSVGARVQFVRQRRKRLGAVVPFNVRRVVYRKFVGLLLFPIVRAVDGSAALANVAYEASIGNPYEQGPAT